MATGKPVPHVVINFPDLSYTIDVVPGLIGNHNQAPFGIHHHLVQFFTGVLVRSRLPHPI